MTRPSLRSTAALLGVLAVSIFPQAASADLVSTATTAAAPTTTTASTFNAITDWSTLFPNLSPVYDPNDPNICNTGKPQCVDAVAKEMTKRFQPLSDSCSHNALFS